MSKSVIEDSTEYSLRAIAYLASFSIRGYDTTQIDEALDEIINFTTDLKNRISNGEK